MWKINDQAWIKAAESPALLQLFAILEAVFGKDGETLPHSLRQAEPFILCRDFRKPAWDGAPMELYRFQLGPRAWGRPVYVHDGQRVDGRMPVYEQDALRLAIQLKDSHWETAALALIDAAAAGDFPSGADKSQVTVCWQDGARYCVIQDLETRKAAAFRWTVTGLELLGDAHPERLNQIECLYPIQVYDRPVLPLSEGARVLRTAERAGRMDEFLEAVHWRYATRLDERLDGLLLEACDRLQMIEGEIGMAFAGHRFNDAMGDDAWLAVRHDDFAWENGAYFRSDAASLRAAPYEIHAILGILVHLQASGVAAALNECYGYPVEGLDVIGLFREAGKHYFACCNSQGACGPVYEIDRDERRTKLCGFTDRFDWNFNVGRRAGGMTPQTRILDIVTLAELVRRVRAGDTPYEGGPPHDLDVRWMAYLPCDPNE